MKECKELIALVLSLNPSAKFGVMTNGLLFNDYWRETFVDHGYEVNFSLNGASQSTHETINVNSKYNKVMDNLTRLIELRSTRANTLAIYVSFVIVPENVHEIAAFVELANRLGVNARFFYDASRMPEAGDSEKVEEEIARSFAALKTHRDRIFVEGLAAFYRHYCRNSGIENRLNHEKEAAPPKCMAPWKGLNVDRLGQVRFCCMSSLMLGNLNRNDIHEIWNGHRAQMFRKRMAVDDYRYCQASCILNAKPNYAVDYVKADYYVRKFVTEFRSSPKLAYRKAVRKIRQFV
jgi:MoaA/NifB/PqqE/SkfB family radical SAM enzyme